MRNALSASRVTQESASTNEPPRKGRANVRRAIAAIVVALGIGGATIASAASPASASAVSPAIGLSGEYIACGRPWGAGTAGTVTSGLPSVGSGVVKQIWLYKSGANNAPIYQWQTDWAVSNNNYGWETNGFARSGSIGVTVYGSGWYYLYVKYTTRNGAIEGWSANGCWL